MPNADVIVNVIKDQANQILSAVLGTDKLQSFNVGALGNMPYYWQNPRDLSFNNKTYKWIDACLKARTLPLQLDQPFSNLFTEVLSAVGYSLSTDDQAKLNAAKANITNQQMAVLQAWQDAEGEYPSGTGEPMDRIANEIATKWADPATDLPTMQRSKNLARLLNKTPASGGTVIPVFANWLNAWGASISLENASVMNHGYLDTALDNLQHATTDNGGLTLDNKSIVPRYTFAAGSATSAIINGLKNADQKVSAKMTVVRTSESEVTVSAQGGVSATIPIGDFLRLRVDAQASYFQSDIATSSNEVTVQLDFPGVTLVTFGPEAFSLATGLNWFWTQPIIEAIKNGSQDVSGFKFSPVPRVDFSKDGPFGYLQGVAISNYPTVTITVKSASYQRIQQTFQQSASVQLTLLGIPLGIGGSESSYSNKVSVDTANSTVTVTLTPPKELVAGSAVDSVGWVLGVLPAYPAA